MPIQANDEVIMEGPTEVPAHPSASDIFRYRIFEEPLVPAGGDPTLDENQSFAAALLDFSKSPRLEDFSSLYDFLDKYPASPWNVSLLTNLGTLYYNRGLYSKALNAWRHASTLALPATIEDHNPIADRAVGEYACMLARVGRMAELGELLQVIEGHAYRGPATERIAAARAGLAEMRTHPESSFRCGPLALHRLMLATHPDNPKTEMIDAFESTDRGCSLAQVAEMTHCLGLRYQTAFRERGADLVVPAVAHLAVDHFAAVVRHDGDRYLLEDPTFMDDAWVTADTLDIESSGYFLVPVGGLPPGWRTVEFAEAETVWGRGFVPKPPRPPGPCDHSTGCCPCPGGMAVAKVHLLNVSLNITDEPVGYSPPVGPAVRIRVRYNQRDDQFASNFNYSNIGPKWTLDWISFIKDSPDNPQSDVLYYMMGGGNRQFTNFDSKTQTYGCQLLDQTNLIRTSPTSYEMISPNGTRKIFSQSDAGVTTRRIFLTQLIDPAGNSITLTYDKNMRIVSIMDAIGQKTILKYEDASDIFKVTAVTEPFGRSAAFTYAGGKLASIVDAIGMVSEFTYDDVVTDFIKELKTPYGVTKFAMAENGTTRSLEILYPDGSKERVEFNQDSNLGIPAMDPLWSIPRGMSTRNEFLYARNTYHWDRQGCAYAYGDYTKARIYHWVHSADGQSPMGILKSVKEPLEGRVWYDYPGQTGPLESLIVGTTSKPSHVGRVLDDGSTQLYSYEHNDSGKVTKTIDPIGRTFSYRYADNGIDLLEIRQTRVCQNALVFRATYNARHRPVTVVDQAGQTTSYTYNTRGQVLTETDPRGDTTAYHYDKDGYRISVDGPLGAGDTTTWTYDDAGRIKTKTDNSGYTLTFDYDDLDRLRRITYPDSTFEQLTYTLLDRTQFQDRAGRQTTFEYNALQQMTKRVDPLDRITRFEWCKCGALRRLTDPLGRTTTWRHDIQGRTNAKEYPDGSQIHYRYENTTSRLRQRIDEKQQISQYSYNRDDTQSEIRYTNAGVATPAVAFTYDANYPRLSSMTDGTGTTRYRYHPITPIPVLGAGQLRTIDEPSPSRTITYGYDELGRRISTDIDGSVSGIALDAAGRIVRETNDLGSFTYGYVGSSERKHLDTYPNGQTVEYGYRGMIDDLKLERITSQNGKTPIAEFIYSSDASTGNITSWSQQSDTQTPTMLRFEYDDGGQLVSASVSQGGALLKEFDYEYDDAGNRVTEQIDATANTFFCNALNELTSAGGVGTASIYQWDAEQRLVTASSGTQVTQFTYDGRGRVVGIRKEANGSEVSNRKFVWSDGRISEECTASGVVTKRFYSQGVKIETGPNLGAYYYTRDHLGSIHELSDFGGKLRARYTYDPFGRQTKLAGNIDTDFGFAGMLWTTEADLNLTMFRGYDPSIGRWISRDPLGEAELTQGANLYTYVGNNPLNRIDPLGLSCDRELDDWIAAQDGYVKILECLNHWWGFKLWCGDPLEARLEVAKKERAYNKCVLKELAPPPPPGCYDSECEA